MAGTRERALDAAVALVGEGGMRALTHARVDAAAALPPGSTSNWFRTRAALVTGLIDWIAEQERTDLAAALGSAAPLDADGLIDTITRAVELQTGPHALRTRARLTLFLDASPLAQTPLHAQRLTFEEGLRAAAQRLGMPDADAAARTLLACGNGLIMHRLTVAPGAPVRPVIERAVHGCLSAPA